MTVVGKPAATPITSSPGRTARSPRRGEVSAENAIRFADDPELIAQMIEMTPMRRVGQTADLEAIAAYLASDAASFHSGDVITIDGGAMATLM